MQCQQLIELLLNASQPSVDGVVVGCRYRCTALNSQRLNIRLAELAALVGANRVIQPAIVHPPVQGLGAEIGQLGGLVDVKVAFRHEHVSLERVGHVTRQRWDTSLANVRPCPS